MAATVAAASMPAAAATSDARLQLNAKQQAYKKLVDARSAQASDGHLKLLGQSSLELDLNATPAFQLECLLKVLHSIPSFKAVRIRQSHKSLVKKRTSDAVKPDHSRRSSISNSESDLQKSLVSSLSRNHHLVTLELDSIPSSLVKRIPVMIKGSISTLKHLLLRNLEIEDGSLSKLMQTIASSHIYHLEMVACGLNEACGKELKEIISIHNIRRDVAKWQDKLRDQDNVSNSISMGLLHIDLSENSLQDSAIRPIIEALVEDKWVKSLQLSSNSLTNSIIGEFIDLLKVNSVLSSVAVENNPGLDRGMMALLQTTLNQRQSGVEATHSTTEFDSYPATKPVRRSSPKKVDLSSTKPPKAVPTSELVRTLDRLFQEQMTSADGLAREQFREILSGVGKLTDTLGKVQDQLKQVLAENLKLKAEVQAFEKKQSEKENLKRKPKKNTLKATGGHDQRICDQDLDDIMEVMEMFESIFTQLHKYMDAVEASKDDHANAPPENDLRDIFDKVQKSAAIFDNVASKLQPRAQQ